MAKGSPNQKKKHPLGVTTVIELFDIGPAVAFTALAIAGAILMAALVYVIRSAPPSEITISTGPEGSAFYKSAVKYSKILEGNGVKTRILTSKGSLENIQRLNDPASGVDVGFAQAGMTAAPTGPAKDGVPAKPAIEASDRLVSLGSISYQPLLIFYRGMKLELLSQLNGKRVSIGPVGSGTRNFSLALLAYNGIKEAEKTELLDWDADKASDALLKGELDAVFVMSDSTTTETMRTLLRSQGIQLYNFKQANAYSRKIGYVNVLELPEGGIDLGLDIPAHDVTMLGPMVELLATKSLHPALVDLLLEAATDVHSRSGMYQKRGEFPSAIEHAIHISDDASRYYKSGKSYLYRVLPFWLASLLSRVVVVFLPVLFVLIPTMRSIPAFFRWTSQLRLNKRYRELQILERNFLMETDPARVELLRQEFDRIDESVNRMKVRASFADRIYGLRTHIDYVRQLMARRHPMG